MTTTTKERPILFSGPMVRAILDGRKTQTRRVVKPQPKPHYREVRVAGDQVVGRPIVPGPCAAGGGGWEGIADCPFGAPGDTLWVRETWQFYDWCSDGMPHIKYEADGAVLYHDYGFDDDWAEKLQNTWADLSDPKNYAIDGRAADRRWRPSIHMPHWASRLTLEVVSVKVERVQDISEADAVAEGPTRTAHLVGWPVQEVEYTQTARDAFHRDWDWINGNRWFGWEANPWVWAVTFQRADHARQT